MLEDDSQVVCQSLAPKTRKVEFPSRARKPPFNVVADLKLYRKLRRLYLSVMAGGFPNTCHNSSRHASPSPNLTFPLFL
jgi:hypothetical protein